MADPWTRGGGGVGVSTPKPPQRSASQSICADSHVRSRSMKAATARPVAIDGYLSIFLKPDEVKPQ